MFDEITALGPSARVAPELTHSARAHERKHETKRAEPGRDRPCGEAATYGTTACCKNNAPDAYAGDVATGGNERISAPPPAKSRASRRLQRERARRR